MRFWPSIHKNAVYWTGDKNTPLALPYIPEVPQWHTLREEDREEYWIVVAKVYLELTEIDHIRKNNITATLTFPDPTQGHFSYSFVDTITPQELIDASDRNLNGKHILVSVFEKEADGKKYIENCKAVFEEFKELITSAPAPDFNDMRFAHCAIFAPSGSGKTNLISNLIYDDFLKVHREEASVIVMESNSDLAESIAHLADFAPGMPLHGKLIYIDVADVEYPVALNLFDLGKADGATALEKEILHNSAVAMLDYIFTSLLQTELTGRQQTLFNFLVFLMLEIPGATLDTMIEVLQRGGAAKYASNLLRCNKDTQDFFANRFDAQPESKNPWVRTKGEIEDRLYAVKRNQTLARIFSAPKTKLNLFDEIGKGRVIVINASQAVLGPEGAEQFGRFWIAMILMAAQRRQLVTKAKRLPTYVYLDECQDFVKNDSRVSVLLDQARKFGVGLTLATQRMDSISPPIVSSIVGGTAIKFAAHLSSSHAHMLAQDMRCDEHFIMNQKKHHFAMYVRGMQKPQSVTYIEVDFLKKLRMSAEEMGQVRDEMRERYCTSPQSIEPEPSVSAINAETLDSDEPPSEKPRRKDASDGW